MSFIERFSAGTLRSPPLRCLVRTGYPGARADRGSASSRCDLSCFSWCSLSTCGCSATITSLRLFTRVCFDTESFRTHRSMVLFLPIAAWQSSSSPPLPAWLVAHRHGLPVLAVVRHYTRRSEGIEKRLCRREQRRRSGRSGIPPASVHYAMPIAGILTVSARQPQEFVFLPIKTLPVPWELVLLAQAFALFVVLTLDARAVAHMAQRPTGSDLLGLYGYSPVDLCSRLHRFRRMRRVAGWSSTCGTTRSTSGSCGCSTIVALPPGVDPRDALLSTAQPDEELVAVRGGLRDPVHSLLLLLVARSLSLLGGASNVAYLAAFYQIVNFHHCIVDSKIWKLRRPAVRQNIGIA